MAAGDVLVLIPARMASRRLPGKPLADLCGRPMIVHVLERAMAAAVGPVVVATDSAYRPLSQVTPWQSRIPNSRLATIPGGGFHPAAVAPDLCAETTLAFLHEIDRTARAATGAA